LPGFDPVADLVYAASSECVEAVICAGRVLMERRKIEGEEVLIKNISRRYGKRQA